MPSVHSWLPKLLMFCFVFFLPRGSNFAIPPVQSPSVPGDKIIPYIRTEPKSPYIRTVLRCITMGYTKFITAFITRPPPIIWWLAFKYVSFRPSSKSITSSRTDSCRSFNPFLFASSSARSWVRFPPWTTKRNVFARAVPLFLLPAYAFRGFVHRRAWTPSGKWFFYAHARRYPC